MLRESCIRFWKNAHNPRCILNLVNILEPQLSSKALDLHQGVLWDVQKGSIYPSHKS